MCERAFAARLIAELISVYLGKLAISAPPPGSRQFAASLSFSTAGSLGGVCPVAHYCPEGSAGPAPCPAGTYTNLTGQSLCSRCPSGYYCAEKADDFTHFPCPPGFYCPDGRPSKVVVGQKI